MRTILRTVTRQIVAGLRQIRLAVVGAVEVREDNRLRTCDFHQHALAAAARRCAAFERAPMPAVALVPTGHTSSGMAALSPRCWQPKSARQRASASRG